MTWRSCLISGGGLLGKGRGRAVGTARFGGENSGSGRDEETGEVRRVGSMNYQISDCTSPRPFTRMSTTARL